MPAYINHQPTASKQIVGQLSLAELEDRILAIRRMATREHVPETKWKLADRMRKRAEALRKQG